jgi:hypothetical protein
MLGRQSWGKWSALRPRVHFMDSEAGAKQARGSFRCVLSDSQVLTPRSLMRANLAFHLQNMLVAAQLARRCCWPAAGPDFGVLVPLFRGMDFLVSRYPAYSQISSADGRVPRSRNRDRESGSKYRPKFKTCDAPIITYGTQYPREYVSMQTGFRRIIPSPALLARPLIIAVRFSRPTCSSPYLRFASLRHQYRRRALTGRSLNCTRGGRTPLVLLATSSGDFLPRTCHAPSLITNVRSVLGRRIACLGRVPSVVTSGARPPSSPKAFLSQLSSHFPHPPFPRPGVDVCPHGAPATATCGGRRRHYGTAGFLNRRLVCRISPFPSVSESLST